MKKPKGFFVTGTDTGVGKTLVSLGLSLYFKADYWKPIQTGTDTDTDYIRSFLPENRIHKSLYEFKEPLSPNQASELENQSIDLKKLSLPASDFLIVEGLGGVYVPLNETDTLFDLMALFKLPLIIVARSEVGTLNHTFLTLEALRARNLEICGLVLSGKAHPMNKRDLEKWGKVSILLEIPPLSVLTKQELGLVFQKFQRNLIPSRYLP